MSTTGSIFLQLIILHLIFLTEGNFMASLNLIRIKTPSLEASDRHIGEFKSFWFH